jgi:hypothetical protein
MGTCAAPAGRLDVCQLLVVRNRTVLPHPIHLAEVQLFNMQGQQVDPSSISMTLSTVFDSSYLAIK